MVLSSWKKHLNGVSRAISQKAAAPSESIVKYQPQNNMRSILIANKFGRNYRELYGDTFSFEGSRAIVFNTNDKIPIEELKHCIFLALTYHNRKYLPMLGV
jgi:hypothetical protein